jgi:hypothetical protein
MSNFKFKEIDLLFTMFETDSSVTISRLVRTARTIREDFLANNIIIELEVNYLYIESGYQKYKNYFNIKYNSGDPIFIKKKDIDFKYTKVPFNIQDLRKYKIKNIL